MTTIAETIRLRNRLAQRKRRLSPAAKETDRAYMRNKRLSAEFREQENDVGKSRLRDPATWARTTLARIRHRAKKRGLDFDLCPDDLALPATCPVLGIPLFFREEARNCYLSPNSPSVDRLDNTKGYVRGNVRVISMRANALKKDANTAEIKALFEWMVREGAP